MVSGRAGYTLTEMMVVVGIIGAVCSTSALVIQKTLQAQLAADALASIQSGAFTSFDLASRLLRQASAASVVIDRYDSSCPPWSRVTFTIPSSGKTVRLYQRGQTLYLNNNPLFSDLRNVTFAFPATAEGDVMTVSLTFEKAAGSGKTKVIQLYIQNVKIQNS
ncbi:MAG: prepilin-type N-terminal cleavage/methylation domain-containing protein [Elusimicrobia bacterium]|nr:prepilin-type N-terminal cleavage/methylation domain-containing protein [Elusimicrobiota bacterium]